MDRKTIPGKLILTGAAALAAGACHQSARSPAQPPTCRASRMAKISFHKASRRKRVRPPKSRVNTTKGASREMRAVLRYT